MPSPNEANLQIAVLAANKVWYDWQDVFEHAGRLGANPILADSDRFTKFLTHWSVARTIRRGTKDEFRCELRDSAEFSDALNDPTGRALDELHRRSLRPRFGTQDGKRGFVSALSKIAAFVKPDVFTAWDSYAIVGLNLAVGRSKTLWYESYAEYLSFFNAAWEGPCGMEIRARTNPESRSVAAQARFQRRVLDLYLMAEGGYKHTELLENFPDQANPAGKLNW